MCRTTVFWVFLVNGILSSRAVQNRWQAGSGLRAVTCHPSFHGRLYSTDTHGASLPVKRYRDFCVQRCRFPPSCSEPEGKETPGGRSLGRDPTFRQLLARLRPAAGSSVTANPNAENDCLDDSPGTAINSTDHGGVSLGENKMTVGPAIGPGHGTPGRQLLWLRAAGVRHAPAEAHTHRERSGSHDTAAPSKGSNTRRPAALLYFSPTGRQEVLPVSLPVQGESDGSLSADSRVETPTGTGWPTRVGAAPLC